MTDMSAELRRKAIDDLISDAGGIGGDITDLCDRVWDFGEEMVECEREIDQLGSAIENMIKYLGGRKEALVKE